MESNIVFERFLVKQKLHNEAIMRYLKAGVWLYFYLLIFEGALRKWFLPALASPLLIIRDPIALFVVVIALNKRILRPNIYIFVMLFVSVIAFFTAILFGHGNLYVALFGFRILFIHFPFMFAIGAIFNSADIIKMGKITLWITIPMAVLIGIQFYSPQSAWVNRGVGGDVAGAGFAGALGYFRPPGTFSFTNGNALFFSLAGMYLLYFLLNTKKVNRFALIGASIGLITAIPLSISRTLLFSLVFCAVFMLISVSLTKGNSGKVLIGIAIFLFVFAIISQLPFFQTATEVFNTRFTNANEQEGGLVEGVIGDRYFGGLLSAFANSSQIPFFGLGLGMGTNVGSQILTGKLDFLVSEGEWGRLIGEMGLLLGLIVILLRLSFCLEITIAAYRRLSQRDVLPWLTLSYALLIIPQGQWSQPTALGFSALSGGMVLASLRN